MLSLIVKSKYENNIQKGYPWVLKGEYLENSALELAEPGEQATALSSKGKFLAAGYFNPHSFVAFRSLTRDKNEKIDTGFFVRKIKISLEKREKLFKTGYYRLIHSEGDGLPGLIIDRFGDILVCQISTAGIERLKKHLVEALSEVVNPQTIIFRNDVSSRLKEGIKTYVRIEKGEYSGALRIEENGCHYFADLLEGQKTGWFYDQRLNRSYVAGLCLGKTLLDVYSHSGGFGILAAKAGAKEVTFIDSSEKALALGRLAAKENNITVPLHYIQAKAFDALEKLKKENRRFTVVLLDPPAFVKTRKDKKAGMQGYQKLLELGMALVEEGGILTLTSCSHHAPKSELLSLFKKTAEKVGRKIEIIKTAGAAPDHPKHPMLDENDYLKFIAGRL